MEMVKERLASFYLGSRFDLKKGQVLDEPVDYDARDLTTHGVILGMTGSGKTGLGIILLEEAALDGVPSLIIDPKGDMTNLLLTFPELRPADFLPWVNADDARRKDMELEAYASSQAESWRKGLEGSGQGLERIKRLKEAADFVIYTPGSSAGRQVSILQTFKVPALSWDTDSELLRDKVGSVVSALLGLIGIEADPMRSREHILLANIFENAWRAGQDLDLAQLILRVQKPPFSQLGVFPVDTFFPEKDRMALAMLINGLVASPSFADWVQGQPLEIDGLLHGPSGKPQVSILYIAHLSEAERQFFVTLLLEQVVSWMRAQTGTTSLRALLYMDEVFGYLPPHPGNPPTKKPMITLLKQARAFGLGLLLATQNPVDLDYKALSNAGTWFIGRMQAERDKARLLDGLEGVEAGKSGPSRAELDRMISGIQSRVFILHNVHEDKPVVFTTRWAMSYLRGPLTRTQVQQLMASQAPTPAAAAPAAAVAPGGAQPAAVTAPAPVTPPAAADLGLSKIPPQLPSAVKQVFLPVRISLSAALNNLSRTQGITVRASGDQDGSLVCEPGLLGRGRILYSHTPSRQSYTAEATHLLVGAEEIKARRWVEGRVKLDEEALESEPPPNAVFAELPVELGASKSLTELSKEFQEFLFYNSSASLGYNPHLKLYQLFDETDQEFVRRCRLAAEKQRDAEAKSLEAKNETKKRQLEDKLAREERELEEDKARHSGRKQEELLSGAEMVFGLLGGRKSSRRLSSASRRRRMTGEARAEVEESEKTIKELQAQIDELVSERDKALEELNATWAEKVEAIEQVEVRPTRTNVKVDLLAVAWVPRWEVQAGGQTLLLPAVEIERIG